MSTVDERIVRMKFENTQFQSGAKTALGLLDSLKQKLNFSSSRKGLDDLAGAGKNFSLAGMAQSVEGIASKFSAMSIVGITALTNLTNKAVNAGLDMAKSLTIAPVGAGFAEYELKMGSIQTILSNTARYGTKLPEVTKNLDDLNRYADKTIYNFGDMTKNIGLFTNAGIKIKDATSMIKGFSNEAAASGTSAEGSAAAAYQLSQALSAGKITLMDWRSLQNVGMGNKNMQKGITDIAGAMGTLKDKGTSASKVQKDFNGSLKSGWLSADVMSNYLKIMAGDMSVAQMKTLGLNDAQIKQFQTQQKNGEEAATKVRTFTQLVGTLQEAVGSGWTDTWNTIIGDFNTATTLWTGVSNTLGGMIGKMSDARNKMVGDWAKAGGRTALIDALANSWNALLAIIKPIKEAFQEIFPPATGKQLADMTKTFRDFTAHLKIGASTSAALKNTFKGLFAVISIGWAIFKGLVSFIAGFFTVVTGGTGGILQLTGGIGSLIVKLQEWITSGDKIGTFFAMLSTARTAILKPIFDFVGKIVGAFGQLFKGNPAGFFDAIKNSFSALNPLVGMFQQKFASVLAFLSTATAAVKLFFAGLGVSASGTVMTTLTRIQSGVDTLRVKFDGLVQKLVDVKSNLKFNIDSSGIQNVVKSMSSLGDVGGKTTSIWTGLIGAFDKAQEILAPVSQGIGELFATIKDKIMEYIRGLSFEDAVALLNTGFFILLYKMLKTFLGNLNDLVGNFSGIIDSITGVFDQLTDTLKTMQKSVQAGIILKIAVALALLVVAVMLLSKVDVVALAKALGAITILFAELMGTLKVFSMINTGGPMAQVAGQLLLLAIAVDILAIAVAKLGGLSWEELAKGLVGVGGLLASLALFTKFASANQGGIKTGAGLILLAVAIRLLASSVSVLGNMDTGVLIKGITSLGVMIAMLAVMVKAINGVSGIPQAAAGLLILSLALLALSVTLKVYANIDFVTLVTGLASMAATLVIVGAAMRLMPANLPATAAGLLIVSAALVILAGALKIMGAMDGDAIGKALITLAGSMLILALALQAMTGTAAGAAALIIAAGALYILAGVLAALGQLEWETIGKGLAAIAGVLLVLGVAALLMAPVVPVLTALGISIAILGGAMLLAGAGFLLFATGFATMAAVGTAGVAVLVTGFTAILGLVPLLFQQIALGIKAFAKVISGAGPELIAAITTVLTSLLQAINNTAPKFFATMTKLILGLIQVVVTLIPALAGAGLKLIMGFLLAISNHVPVIVAAAMRMVVGILNAVNNYVPRIVALATVIMLRFLSGVSSGATKIVAKVVQMIVDFLSAVTRGIPRIAEAGVKLIQQLMTSISNSIPKLVASGFKMIIDLVNGISNAIDSHAGEVGAAGGRLAVAIVRGMANGIIGGVGEIGAAARTLASNALSSVAGFLGIHSPSREFYKLGAFVVAGFRNGIDGNKAQVQSSFDSLKKMLVDMKATAKKEIDTQIKKLAALRKARHRDTKAINAATAALINARREYSKSNNAYLNLTRNWTDDKNRLGYLANNYDKLTAKLKTANEALAEATKIRGDYYEGIKDQYSKRPDIASDTSIQDYANNLRKQSADNLKMRYELNELLKLGLNKGTFAELVTKGTDAIPFIEQLLGTGKSGVAQINKLTADLDKSAGVMAVTTTAALYQAGVDSARGIIKGLQSQQSALEKQMDAIANAMVASIKRSLQIKSPSRVFMVVGKFINQGLAKGLDQYSGIVSDSSAAVGHEAINALRKTLAGLDSVVTDDINMRPVIAPVLDLTDVRKGAGSVADLLKGSTLGVGSAYSQARSASTEHTDNQLESAWAAILPEPKAPVQFVQNNSSPKALSEAELYRQTKNQLSVAKEALK